MSGQIIKDDVRGTGQMWKIGYWAPELLQRDVPYGHKVDVYAFAVLFNEIWSTTDPYPETMVPRVIAAGVKSGELRPKMSPNVPAACRRVIEVSWAQDPAHRPGMDKVEAILAQPAEQLLQWA